MLIAPKSFIQDAPTALSPSEQNTGEPQAFSIAHFSHIHSNLARLWSKKVDAIAKKKGAGAVTGMPSSTAGLGSNPRRNRKIINSPNRKKLKLQRKLPCVLSVSVNTHAEPGTEM
jgi:hypothetical protein